MIGIIVQNLKCKFAIIQTPNNCTAILKNVEECIKIYQER